ncbi:MAG: hypothetical protein DSZ09_00900 [Sulfurovum sp.]|nr:MAG: hypothetical protein DSZ09_00900 [Sulfurovum sp.]RUM73594.1 MAG: hypothetical protein DSZ12_06975 [Sulfurovum sp.]
MHNKPQEEELQKYKTKIKQEIKQILEENMRIFDMDIPENDDKKSAILIYTAMQESMEELKLQIDAGKYDFF